MRRWSASLLWFLPLAAQAQGEGGVPVDTVTYAFKTLLALLLVVALVLVSAWALRRLQGLAPGGGGRIRVLAAVSVGARERLVVVEVGGEQLLIGVAPGQVRKVHVLAEPLALEGTPAPEGFARRLRQALSREAGS